MNQKLSGFILLLSLGCIQDMPTPDTNAEAQIEQDPILDAPDPRVLELYGVPGTGSPNVTLAGWRQHVANELVELSSTYPTDSVISISISDLSPEVMQTISSNNHLQWLRVHGDLKPCDPAFINWIGTLEVKGVCLSGIDFRSDHTTFPSLCAELKWLATPGSLLDVNCFKTISQLKELVHLDVPFSNCNDEMISLLPKNDLMVFLGLDKTNVSDSAIEIISQRFSSLEMLGLYSCSRVSSESFQHLRRLNKLRRVSLGQTPAALLDSRGMPTGPLRDFITTRGKCKVDYGG